MVVAVQRSRRRKKITLPLHQKGNRSRRRKIYPRSSASGVEKWGIMPHNVLLRKRIKRRSKILKPEMPRLRQKEIVLCYLIFQKERNGLTWSCRSRIYKWQDSWLFLDSWITCELQQLKDSSRMDSCNRRWEDNVVASSTRAWSTQRGSNKINSWEATMQCSAMLM